VELPEDIVPEGHLIWFIDKIVDDFDLSAIMSTYSTDGRGRPPYDPALMVKLLIYCYCTGRESSREIEESTYEDIPCRVLVGDRHPDHDTISSFRRQHLPTLGGLFDQVLKLADQASLVGLETVATDGSKVLANASKHKAMSYERMLLKETQLEEELDTLRSSTSQEASRVDVQAEIERREIRLQKILKAKNELEQEAKQKAAEQAAATRQSRAELEERYEKQIEAGLKDRRGLNKSPKIADPEKAVPPPTRQRNFTDPDSYIMLRGSTKSFEQCYNAQVAVDSVCQIIVGCYVTRDPNDKMQLIPMARQIKQRFGRLPNNLLADSGFYSEANVTSEELAETELYVPPGKECMGKNLPSLVGRIPNDLSVAHRMWRKLRTTAANAVYRRRKCIVEPVIGQIKKCALDFDQFKLRGLKRVNHEFSFVCAMHNLLKLYRYGPQFAVTSTAA